MDNYTIIKIALYHFFVRRIIMQINEDSQPTGSLRISREVIASIASTTAKEIPGVASLAPFTADIKGWIARKQITKPINIDLTDDIAVIDINVILKFGAHIPQVAAQIQSSVKEAIQSMTGIAVSRVNVTVAGIDLTEVKQENPQNQQNQQN